MSQLRTSSVSHNDATTANIILFENGDSHFASDVLVGGDPVDGLYPGTELNVEGGLSACRTGGVIFAGYKQGTSTATSVIHSDGTASFVGGRTLITSDGDIQCGNTNGTQRSILGSDGECSARRDGGGATDYAFAVYNGGSQAANIQASIAFDGSASFAAAKFTIANDGEVGAAGDIALFNPGSFAETARIYAADGNASFSQGNIKLNLDGSADFAGGILNVSNAGSLFTDNNGAQSYLLEATASGGYLSLYPASTSPTIQFNGNTGTGTFTGAIEGQRATLPSTTGNGIGQVHFTAVNSTQIGSAVTGQSEGAWATNSSYPSRLMFWTCNSGESVPTERARIDRAGIFRVGGAASGSPMPDDTGAVNLYPDGRIIAPGTYATTAANNPRTLYVDNGGLFGGVTSIRAAKKNIEYDYDSSWILSLKPVTFNYRKQDEETKAYTEEAYDDNQYGLIAEDVEEVNPAICNYNGDKLTGVEYSRLVTPILSQLQQALTRIEELEAKVTALES